MGKQLPDCAQSLMEKGLGKDEKEVVTADNTNTICPHGAKFLLIKIDVSVCQIGYMLDMRAVVTSFS